MMNHNQRRILAEAIKHGGTNTSKIDQMAKVINEETLSEARKLGKRQLEKVVHATFNKHFNGVTVPLMKLVAIFKEIEAAIVSGADPEKAMAEIKKKYAIAESTEISEAPVLTGGEAAPTLFGWSKHQFEAKFRELLTRMGFERGIIHIKTEGQEMKMYFANAAKARDFVVAFNGLARRKSMGSVASVATQFNKIKSPTGTNAIVSLDLSMVRGESLDLDGTDLYEWFSDETETITEGYERKILNSLEDAGFKKGDAWFENGILYVAKKNLIARAKTAIKKNKDIHQAPEIRLDPTMEGVSEETVSEGGVKAALADFMEGLPKEMVAEIRKIYKLEVVNLTYAKRRRNKIEAIRKKYKIPADFMGTPTWKIIVDYFKTFHGESVEEGFMSVGNIAESGYTHWTNHTKVVRISSWVHKETGRSVSSGGAVPWRTPAERQMWEEDYYFVFYDTKNGTTFGGRYNTEEKAQAALDKAKHDHQKEVAKYVTVPNIRKRIKQLENEIVGVGNRPSMAGGAVRIGRLKDEIKRLKDQLRQLGMSESTDWDGEMVTEYYRRSGFRSSSYSGDPRWITAKYAGVDAKGRPFKKGEEVLYFPNGKKIYSGPEAEKQWREFLSAKGDEMGMPYAS